MSSERAGLYSVFPALFLYLYIGFLSIYVNGSITFLTIIQSTCLLEIIGERK